MGQGMKTSLLFFSLVLVSVLILKDDCSFSLLVKAAVSKMPTTQLKSTNLSHLLRKHQIADETRTRDRERR